MRIAMLLQPMSQIPPPKYGGISRVVHLLINGLLQKNHDVTLYTAKPACVDCEVVMPAGVIEERFENEIGPYRWIDYAVKTLDHIKELGLRGMDYDVINNHYDPIAFVLGRREGLKAPMLTTIHGEAREEKMRSFSFYPDGNFSAVSESQRQQILQNGFESMNFIGVVYNAVGDNYPFSENKLDYLFLVSRIGPEKGQKNAIEIARKTGLDLIIGGRPGWSPTDNQYFREEVLPNVDIDLSEHESQEERNGFIQEVENYRPSGGKVTYLGEVTGEERDQLMKHSRAFLFPIEWEEPFGLVMTEAGVVGTPVIAYKRGAVPEIIEQGKTGFYGDTLDELVEYTRRVGEINPSECHAHVREKFSVDKMVDGYLELYEEAIHRRKNVIHLPVFCKA